MTGGATVSQLQGGGLLPGVGEAVDIDQLRGIVPVVDQQTERTASVDGLELGVVTDQQHLRPASSAACVIRSKERVPAREASSMITSCPALKVTPVCWWVVHHFAVFSVAIPRSSASTCAATADGASPTTDPTPCEASHARRSAFIAVVLSTCRV